MFVPDTPADVIRNHKDMVYRIAFSQCRNHADADDLTQEVFVQYIHKKPELFSEEHLKAWLIRVTINASKSLLRSAWRRKIVPLSEYEHLPADEKTQSATLCAVLSLPEKYRLVILLYYFEDYSVNEIAGILGRTKTAIQTQLYRARAMLKELLKEDWGND